MQKNLFGELESENEKPKRVSFGNKSLSEAILYINNLKNQDTGKFNKLKAEMYAWAIENNNREMFDFLESRFKTVEIPDKEIHLHFEAVNSREEARA
jgi:hypothetical protein